MGALGSHDDQATLMATILFCWQVISQCSSVAETHSWAGGSMGVAAWLELLLPLLLSRVPCHLVMAFNAQAAMCIILPRICWGRPGTQPQTVEQCSHCCRMPWSVKWVLQVSSDSDGPPVGWKGPVSSSDEFAVVLVCRSADT